MQVFGKLTKGAAAFSAGENASIVEQLIHRVKETTALSEKRSALHDLKDLIQNNNQEKGVFGSIGGIPTLIALLTESDDLELVQTALEALLLSTTDDGTQESTEASTNCEMLIRSSDHLAVILSLLDPSSNVHQDFYIYYHCVLILGRCVKRGLYKVQEVVGRGEHGMPSLLRMLSEREAIRNEMLLILNQLIANNRNLQTAAARGDIFTKLFKIMQSEGVTEGSIVIQDCLELLTNVLRDNDQTQRLCSVGNFFRELMKCLELVDVRTLGAEALLAANHNLTKQRLDNLRTALQLTEMLVPLSSPQLHTAQLAALQVCIDDVETEREELKEGICISMTAADCLPVFSQLALNQGGVHDTTTRIKALRCLGTVLLLDVESKTLFMKLRVFLNSKPAEAVVAALKVALGTGDREETVAAMGVLESFFDQNAEAQERIISAIVPIEGRSASNGAFVAELLQTVETCKQGSEIGRKAITVLSYLIRGNSVIQLALLKHKIPLPLGQEPDLTLVWFMRLLSQCLQSGTTSMICLALSECIMDCIDGCPAAVEALLQVESHITLLVGQLYEALLETTNTQNWKITGSGCISIILAVCLSTVVERIEHPNSEAMREYLKTVIKNSAEADSFLFLLKGLQEKAKGTGYKGIRLRLSRVVPVVQSYLQPNEPIVMKMESPIDNRTAHQSATSIDAKTETRGAGTVVQPGMTEDVPGTEVTILREELSNVNRELTVSKQREAELKLTASRQEMRIQELLNQNAELLSKINPGIDAQTKDALLVCIGIEHTKVKVLSERLLELGCNPDVLLMDEIKKQL